MEYSQLLPNYAVSTIYQNATIRGFFSPYIRSGVICELKTELWSVLIMWRATKESQEILKFINPQALLIVLSDFSQPAFGSVLGCVGVPVNQNQENYTFYKWTLIDYNRRPGKPEEPYY